MIGTTRGTLPVPLCLEYHYVGTSKCLEYLESTQSPSPGQGSLGSEWPDEG